MRCPLADPLVTCVIPVFNGQPYLRQAIESVLAQTYDPVELVIVDDGSTDQTPAIVSSFRDRVRGVRQDNQGPAAARNQGLKAARGQYLSFLDADDLWTANKTMLQVDLLEQRRDLQYCVGRMENFLCDSVPADQRPALMAARVDGAIDGFSPITLLARRALFDRIGGFDASLLLGEDWEWFLRAHDARTAHTVVPEVLARRRIHLGNRTHGQSLAHRQALLPILRASLARKRLAMPDGRTGGSEPRS